MIRTLCLKLNLLSLHFSNCILTLFCICSQLVFLWSLPNHIPNTFTLSFTSWCIYGWLIVSGLPIFRISFFCSFIHKNTNWLQIQNKFKIQFEKWRDRRLSLRHKVLIINTYILSKILYVARIVPPSAKHIQIINRYIYTIFWVGNFEYLQRKSLIQPFCNGGQQVPDRQTKINALLLNRITQVLKGNNSAWTSIFSYFLGYTTRYTTGAST
jgi:hypothetical protein